MGKDVFPLDEDYSSLIDVCKKLFVERIRKSNSFTGIDSDFSILRTFFIYIYIYTGVEVVIP